jgi:phosphonate transport system ATP-binding protein
MAAVLATEAPVQAAAVPTALRVDRLAKRFPGATAPVWSDISFDVPAGQRVAIIGGNGTGKSTLLRCCLRLIEPDGGDIRLHGERLTGTSPRNLRRLRSSVGFVFQKHNLVPRLSVLTNVLHGGMARSRGPWQWHQSVARRADREYAMHCLGQVSLAHLAERRADHLSGGQSQRVAIARALMQRPRTIFADEPVASLDPQAGEEVMETFAALAHGQGLTLVFVSHHLEHALRYADRVLGLRAGGLALDAPAAGESLGSLRALYE